MVTKFWRESAKIGIPQYSPSFCALAFHTGREDRNADARVNTADDSSTCVKNLVNFGPVTPEFCRHICAGHSTRSALTCIFWMNYIRQMAPIVDADANRFVSLALAMVRAGRTHAGICTHYYYYYYYCFLIGSI